MNRFPLPQVGQAIKEKEPSWLKVAMVLFFGLLFILTAVFCTAVGACFGRLLNVFIALWAHPAEWVSTCIFWFCTLAGFDLGLLLIIGMHQSFNSPPMPYPQDI